MVDATRQQIIRLSGLLLFAYLMWASVIKPISFRESLVQSQRFIDPAALDKVVERLVQSEMITFVEDFKTRTGGSLFPPVEKLPYGKRKRILVTGGAGFVGSHLVDRLMYAGNDVIVLDNYFTGRRQNIAHWIGHPNFQLILHDVVDPISLVSCVF
jgi:hypothetical protein